MEDQKNNWSVTNVDDFLYYCCPECNTLHKNKDSFLKHAFIQHPKSQQYLHNFEVNKEASGIGLEFNIFNIVQQEQKLSAQRNIILQKILDNVKPKNQNLDSNENDLIELKNSAEYIKWRTRIFTLSSL